MAGFNVVSWYAPLVAVALAYLLWASVLDTGHRHFKAIRRRLRPEQTPPPVPPAVILGPPWYSLSVAPVPDRELEQTRYLTRLEVGFRPFQNNEAAMTLRAISIGIRRRSTGAEAVVPDTPVPSLPPGGSVEHLPRLDAPKEVFDGLTEQNYQDEILTWARFDDPDGRTWEVVWDPVTRTQAIEPYGSPASGKTG